MKRRISLNLLLIVASLLAGGADGRLKTTDFAGTSKITQRLPRQGGRVQAVFDQSRATSQNLFNSLDPQFTTSLSFEFAQPLFRDRRIDEPRRQIKIAKKRLDLSDSQFRRRAIEIVARVEQAYWDLVFALRDEEIKRESVELARSQLAHNQRLVEQGAIAPVDVVSARVEVERRTDEAEAAVETIQRAENALKALTLAPGATQMWGAVLTPVEKPELDSSAPMPFDDALKIAGERMVHCDRRARHPACAQRLDYRRGRDGQGEGGGDDRTIADDAGAGRRDRHGEDRPVVRVALDADRVGACSRASGFRTTDSRQPGLAICRRDALRAGRDRHRHIPGDVQQIAATGAIDELFCQPASFDVVGRDDAGGGDAGMDAAVHVAQPDQPFLDDRARSLAQRRGDRGDLAAYAGAGRIRGRAGGRQRMEVPQTTWMTCDGSIHYAIVCAECCLTMPLQLPCRL